MGNKGEIFKNPHFPLPPPLVVDTALSLTPFSSHTHVLHQKPGLVVDIPLVDDVFALSTTKGGGIFPAWRPIMGGLNRGGGSGKQQLAVA